MYVDSSLKLKDKKAIAKQQNDLAFNHVCVKACYELMSDDDFLPQTIIPRANEVPAIQKKSSALAKKPWGQINICKCPAPIS